MKRQYITPNLDIMQADVEGIVAASAIHDNYTDAEQLVKENNSESWTGDNTSIWDNEW